MLCDSVVFVVVERTRPRAIPLAMITTRKSIHGFPFLSHDEYGAPLGDPSGHRSSAIMAEFNLLLWFSVIWFNPSYHRLARDSKVAARMDGSERSHIKTLDCHGDRNTLGLRRKNWLIAFELPADGKSLILNEENANNRQRRRRYCSIWSVLTFKISFTHSQT